MTHRQPSASTHEPPVSHSLQQLSLLSGDGSGQVASPARKRFNRLLRDLQHHRAQLHAWREAVDLWRTRYLCEVMPLLQQQDVLEIEYIHLMDNFATTFKLSKTDRAFVSDEICELAGPLIEAGHVELKPIYERHNEIGYDEQVSESEAMMKHVIGRLYGLDAEQVASVDSPEELFERIRTRLDQAQADAEDAHEQARQRASQQRRRRSGKKAAPMQAEPPPLRELYRKLASSLHPDRASDASDHAARTELMQRLNAVYKANDLLGLLELQAEIGLLDAQAVNAITPARLQAYNRELDRQCKELKQQLTLHAMDFCDEYGLDLPTQPEPERLTKLLTQHKRDVSDDVDALQRQVRQMRTLDDAPAVKRWLKLQRSRFAFD